MARPRYHLDVWLHGVRVAELTSTGRPNDLSLRYTADALDRWPLNTPVLSCSLPLGNRKQPAANYFRGLLPEGSHLQALAGEANLVVTDLFGLLERYGRDVAGALTIVSAGSEWASIESASSVAPGVGAPIGSFEPYDDASLADEVAEVEDRPLGVHNDSELSLAGVQNKLLLVRDGERWARPIHGFPSTHILKVEDRRYPGLVAAEAAALRLAGRLGLTTVTPELTTLDGIPCIIIDRYDRTGAAPGVERVHQEDFAQAMGHDAVANRGRAKYEAYGGPPLADLAALLDRHAADPIPDLERLAAAVTFNTAIGNADAHAKNYSLLHPEPGTVALAPLYDTVPTLLWPKLPDRSALTVNGRAILTRVTRRDLVDEAARWLLGPTASARVVADTLERLEAELDDPEPSEDGEAVAMLIRERLDALAEP